MNILPYSADRSWSITMMRSRGRLLDMRAGTYYGDKNLKAMFGYHSDELSADPFAWLNLVCPDDGSSAMAQ